MRGLGFLATINPTVPSAFATWYEEALRNEEDRVRATGPLRADPNAVAANDWGPGAAGPPTPSEVGADSSLSACKEQSAVQGAERELSVSEGMQWVEPLGSRSVWVFWRLVCVVTFSSFSVESALDQG